MKIIGYRVEMRGNRSLAELLTAIYDLPLARREIFSAADGLRLESFVHQENRLRLDFARPRPGHGPGRMSSDEELTPFDLEEDEYFGEDTALVIDVATGAAAVQYNHYGPRASAIEDYLSSADHELPGRVGQNYGVDIGIVIRRDAEVRLSNLRFIQSIEAKIAIRGATERDLERGAGLGAVLDSPLPEGIETIRFEMSAGRNAFDLPIARQFISRLQRRDAVQSAIIEGRQAEGERRQRIDLIEEQLKANSALEVGRGRRYSRDARWVALDTQLSGWLRDGAFN